MGVHSKALQVLKIAFVSVASICADLSGFKPPFSIILSFGFLCSFIFFLFSFLYVPSQRPARST